MKRLKKPRKARLTGRDYNLTDFSGRVYTIETWDTDLDKFTPQKGVRMGLYSLFGLRRAIRKLRNMGYPCDYDGHTGTGDPSVSVCSYDSLTHYQSVMNWHKRQQRKKRKKSTSQTC